jgi:hypothetical protein
MLMFQVEKWAQFVEDGKDIFPRHYEELSLEKGIVPMGLDVAKYQEIEDKGMLHVLTARLDGKLIGYYIGIVVTHPHYKDAGLMATTDMFYILPEHRNGVGMKLLIHAANTLKARGVIKVFLGTKLKQDHTALLEALGWTATDKVFTKLLGS